MGRLNRFLLVTWLLTAGARTAAAGWSTNYPLTTNSPRVVIVISNLMDAVTERAERVGGLSGWPIVTEQITQTGLVQTVETNIAWVESSGFELTEFDGLYGMYDTTNWLGSGVEKLAYRKGSIRIVWSPLLNKWAMVRDGTYWYVKSTLEGTWSGFAWSGAGGSVTAVVSRVATNSWPALVTNEVTNAVSPTSLTVDLLQDVFDGIDALAGSGYWVQHWLADPDGTFGTYLASTNAAGERPTGPPILNKAALFEKFGLGNVADLETNDWGAVTGGTALWTAEPLGSQHVSMAQSTWTGAWVFASNGSFPGASKAVTQDMRSVVANGVFPVLRYHAAATSTNAFSSFNVTVTGKAFNDGTEIIESRTEAATLSSTNGVALTSYWWNVTGLSSAGGAPRTGDTIEVIYEGEWEHWGDVGEGQYPDILNEGWLALNNILWGWTNGTWMDTIQLHGGYTTGTVNFANLKSATEGIFTGSTWSNVTASVKLANMAGFGRSANLYKGGLRRRAATPVIDGFASGLLCRVEIYLPPANETNFATIGGWPAQTDFGGKSNGYALVYIPSNDMEIASTVAKLAVTNPLSADMWMYFETWTTSAGSVRASMVNSNDSPPSMLAPAEHNDPLRASGVDTNWPPYALQAWRGYQVSRNPWGVLKWNLTNGLSYVTNSL